MSHLRVWVLIAALTLTVNAYVISGSIRAVIPAGNIWLWVTNDGLIASPTAPQSPSAVSGNWSVTLVCTKGPLKIYELTKGPWVCTVEALDLLGTPLKPKVYWNASLSKVKCGERYLYSDLESSVRNGTQVVLFYPLSGSTCKRVQAYGKIVNDTMIIYVNVTSIKPWIKICPPSKLVDVVVAWGQAKSVAVEVNGKRVFYAKSK